MEGESTYLFARSNLIQVEFKEFLGARTNFRYVLEKDKYPRDRCYDTERGHSFLQELNHIVLRQVSNS